MIYTKANYHIHFSPIEYIDICFEMISEAKYKRLMSFNRTRLFTAEYMDSLLYCFFLFS